MLNTGLIHCDHVLIVTNEHVKEYGLFRDRIIHHGSYNDESFLTVSAIHKSNELSIANGSDPVFEQYVIDFYANRATG